MIYVSQAQISLQLITISILKADAEFLIMETADMCKSSTPAEKKKKKGAVTKWMILIKASSKPLKVKLDSLQTPDHELKMSETLCSKFCTCNILL